MLSSDDDDSDPQDHRGNQLHELHWKEGVGSGQFATDMTIERVNFPDVNGLLGRLHRNPITGQVFLKEVEAWRDFHLVDTWTSAILVAGPEQHAENPYLFKPRALNLRTWIYHSTFRKAKDDFRIGGSEEAFLTDALAYRCVDRPVSGGLWSPTMVYFPLVPLTLLADDSSVFLFAAFILFFSLLVGIFSNSHTYYWWARCISLPARLAFMVLVLVRSSGGAIQLLGYMITLFGALLDLILGDLMAFNSMKMQCSYDVLKTLPNQVLVCHRIGLRDRMAEGQSRQALPEKLIGMKDPGDGSMCLIANVQGLLVELVPMSSEDAYILSDEHQKRAQFADLGNLKFVGVDLLSQEHRTLEDLLTKNCGLSQLHKIIAGRSDKLEIEDIP